MTTQKLTIYNFSDISIQKSSLKHQNAFIFPDGKFCLAKGYTGYNPSQQLEDSALQFSKEIIGTNNIKARYALHLKNLMEKGISSEALSQIQFYYIRSILVHYYGYSLFARIQRMETEKNEEQFWDASILPDPKYHGKEATQEQIKTLQALFSLNNDGTVLSSWNENNIINKAQKILAKTKKKF